MPRRQQRGAGFFDFLSSDPSKKKEANLKKIEELKKESETKCEEIKKLNDVKIEKLNADNMKLEEMINKKNAEPKSSGFLGFFSGEKNESAAVSGQKESGLLSGLFSGSEEPKKVENPVVEEPKKVENPMVEEPKKVEEPKVVGDRMFGGKKRKSQRRRKSKVRKSAKK
jgi:hypothetical protein